MHILLKCRFEYEDFKFADILRESRRDNVGSHERIDGVGKHATIIHADVLGSLQCEQRAADLRYRSATEKLQRIHEETKRGVEDMAGCIQDKVENRLSELHIVVHTDRGGPRKSRRDRQLRLRELDASRCCGNPSGTAWTCRLVVLGLYSQHLQPRRQVGQHVGQVLSMQGAEIVRALQAREGFHSHATEEKTSKADEQLTARIEAPFRPISGFRASGGSSEVCFRYLDPTL